MGLIFLLVPPPLYHSRLLHPFLFYHFSSYSLIMFYVRDRGRRYGIVGIGEEDEGEDDEEDEEVEEEGGE